MIAEQPVERFEDLEDGPVSLGKKDDGKVPQYSWKDGRFVMVPMPKEGKSGVAIASFSPGGGDGTSTIAGATDFTDTTGAGTDGYSIVWDDATNKFILSEITGGASTIAGATDFTDTTGPATDEYTINWDNDTGKFVLRAPVVNTNTTTIADATDFTDTTGAGTDGYSVVWDDATSGFILSEITGGGGTPGGADTQIQFNDGGSFGGDSGFTYDGSGTATLGTALVTPVIKPETDSTTAIKIQDASGTSDIFTVNTTNNKVTFGSAVVKNELRMERDADESEGAVMKSISFDIAYSAIGGGGLQWYLNNYSDLVLDIDPLAGITFFSDITKFVGTGSFGLVTDFSFSKHANRALGATEVFIHSTPSNAFDVETTSFGGGSYRLFTSSFSQEIFRAKLGVLNIPASTFFGDNSTSPTASVDLLGSTTSKSALRIRSGTAPSAPGDGDIWKLSDSFVLHGSNATTNTIVNTMRLRRGSSGTPAANFGAGFNVQLESSTTAGQDAGRITWKWITATHANRASQADFSTYYTSAERTSLSIGSDSSESLLSFHGEALSGKPTITGSRAGNAALADFLTELDTLGLIDDSTDASSPSDPGSEVGQVYTQGASGTQTPGTSYVKLTQIATNGISYGNITPDATNNKITVTDAGIYQVSLCISFSGSPNSYCEGVIFWNGVEQSQIHFSRKIGTGGDIGNANTGGLVDVTTGSTDIDVRVKCDGASDVFDVESLQLVVTRIAPT